MEELLTLHRRAMDDAEALVATVTGADLARDTPCAGWTLADLLAHMVGQHEGFASAVIDGDAPASAYAPVGWSPESWRTSVDRLLDAFEGADPAAEVLEVELHPTQRLPVHTLVGAQLLDTAVHAWDVASSLGRTYRPDDEVVARVLAIADAIPDAESRAAEGAAFAPRLPVVTADPWERTLLLLGRQPATASPSSGSTR